MHRYVLRASWRRCCSRGLFLFWHSPPPILLVVDSLLPLCFTVRAKLGFDTFSKTTGPSQQATSNTAANRVGFIFSNSTQSMSFFPDPSWHCTLWKIKDKIQVKNINCNKNLDDYGSSYFPYVVHFDENSSHCKPDVISSSDRAPVFENVASSSSSSSSSSSIGWWWWWLRRPCSPKRSDKSAELPCM